MISGGYDGQNFLSIVEVYDPNTDKWEDGVSLTFERSGHTSAVSYQHNHAFTSSDGNCEMKNIYQKKSKFCDGRPISTSKNGSPTRQQSSDSMNNSSVHIHSDRLSNNFHTHDSRNNANAQNNNQSRDTGYSVSTLMGPLIGHRTTSNHLWDLLWNICLTMCCVQFTDFPNPVSRTTRSTSL